MGLFDKKYCDICGEKIGLLGNRKLDDGNLCKECAKKLSPWFEERRHSTVEDIKQQLEYREANKEKVQNFRITRRITTKKYTVFLDETQGNFTVAHNLDTKENPDILSLSDVVQCNMDVKQDRIEETYTKDGKTVSYQPPVYKYEYYYSMKIQVRSPWFDDMDFQLHSFAIEQENRAEMMEMERVGNYSGADRTGTENAEWNAYEPRHESRNELWHESRNESGNKPGHAARYELWYESGHESRHEPGNEPRNAARHE